MMKSRRLIQIISVVIYITCMVLNFNLSVPQFGVEVRLLKQTIKGGDDRKLLWTNEIFPLVAKQKTEDGSHTRCITRVNIGHFSNFTKGYMLVHANGGLNQMRLGISDIVAITKLMNVTLVIPSLDNSSYWKDTSKFKDIFDLKHFMNVLRDDIAIVESLPPKYEGIKPYEIKPIYLSNSSYYRSLSKIFEEHEVVKFTHTNNRLSHNKVYHAIQKLRCRANFESLKFTPYIEKQGRKLIRRLRKDQKPYIALHLRYEKDMLAYTGCTHNLTLKEAESLQKMRNDTKHWKSQVINGTERRLKGDCPMTPRETALFLKAIGYPSDTKIYIVSGKIYGLNRLNILKNTYFNLYTHYSLSTREELEPLVNYQNRLAAVDYIVALYSDAFVYTYDGNMAKAVRGHRKFNGFLKSINPDRQRFVELIDQFDEGKISWDEFEYEVRKSQEKRIGAPYERENKETSLREENFYANPPPICICSSRSR